MNQILLILISIFSFLNPFIKKEDDNDFIFISEEAVEDNTIYDDGTTLLTINNGTYRLKIKDTNAFYETSKLEIIVRDNVAYLFYIKDNGLYYDAYDMTGKEVKKGYVITTNEVVSFDVVNGTEDIILYYILTYGTVNYSYLYSVINDTKKEISNTKAEINGLVIDEGYLYLLVLKEGITEGMFGNGGLDKGIVIAKFDCDFHLLNYIVLDEKENDAIRKIEVNDDYVFLINDKSIHVFSKDLESINYKNIGNNLLIKIGKNRDLYVFGSENVKIYDALTLSNIGVIDYDFVATKAEEGDNVVILESANNKYNVDIINQRNLHSYKYLVSSNIEDYNSSINNVSSIFGRCDFIKKEYQEYFSPGYYGTYDLKLCYQTKGNIDFKIATKEVIPLECNVKDNMIYPSGYRIVFNGEGKLDGNQILSNYQIKDIGRHEVEITGSNETKKFTIYVDHNQMALSNNSNLIIDDYKELKKNEAFVITYNLNKNLDIKDIRVEGLPLDSFEVNDNLLTLSFKGLREAGYYYVYLDYFDYQETISDSLKVNNRFYLHDEYWYYVVRDEPKISNSGYLDDMSFSFDLIDEDNTARLIEFELVNESRNYLYNFPIGNDVISFSDLPKGDYELVASLMFDVNNENSHKVKIFSYGVRIDDNISFGEIRVSKENNRYTKVRISIDEDFLKNNVNEIAYDKEVLYSHQETSKKMMITYGVALFVSALIIGVLIKYLYNKAKKSSREDLIK